MKKLKADQKRNCSWCREQGIKTKAVWRGQHMPLPKHACEAHKTELEQVESHYRDDQFTEADYQTWMNL